MRKRIRRVFGECEGERKAMERLFIFGFGQVGRALAASVTARGWRTTGTARTPRDGLFVFDGEELCEEVGRVAAESDAILCAIPPDEQGCPAFRAFAARQPPGRSSWLGYLSTTGVYGDLAGGWAFEDRAPRPDSDQSRRRLRAEEQWRLLGAHIFRLAAIYGPGRSALDRVRAGERDLVIAPGHVRSRIHVDDVASAIVLSLSRPMPGRIYNLSDDAAAPPQDVTRFAAELLGTPPGPEIALKDAVLSPAARRYYEESRRVSNARAKAELGWRPLYPTYREGLAAIHAAGG
jgi:hypothetical protein